jgi:hypothetical protein
MIATIQAKKAYMLMWFSPQLRKARSTNGKLINKGKRLIVKDASDVLRSGEGVIFFSRRKYDQVSSTAPVRYNSIPLIKIRFGGPRVYWA